MGVKKISLVISLLLILFVCCKTRNKSADTTAQTTDADSLFVSLDRSPCFGMCPTFTVNIFKSGYAIYKGKMEVPRIGTDEARFTKEQLKYFDAAAKDYRVDTLQSEYINRFIADYPASYSSIVIKGKRHTFHVSTDTPPENLAQFETTVERLIELAQWRKISDSTQ